MTLHRKLEHEQTQTLCLHLTLIVCDRYLEQVKRLSVGAREK